MIQSTTLAEAIAENQGRNGRSEYQRGYSDGYAAGRKAVRLAAPPAQAHQRGVRLGYQRGMARRTKALGQLLRTTQRMLCKIQGELQASAIRAGRAEGRGE